MARYRRRNPYSRGSFTRGKMETSKTLEQLREIGDHAVQAAKEALRQGADIVVADAKNRCPVDTGKLRDSIHAIPNDNGTEYKIAADAFTTDKHGRKYYYGSRVEFDPEIDKPFLYPAMDAHRDEIYNAVKTAISKAIRKQS